MFLEKEMNKSNNIRREHYYYESQSQIFSFKVCLFNEMKQAIEKEKEERKKEKEEQRNETNKAAQQTWR